MILSNNSKINEENILRLKEKTKILENEKNELDKLSFKLFKKGMSAINAADDAIYYKNELEDKQKNEEKRFEEKFKNSTMALQEIQSFMPLKFEELIKKYFHVPSGTDVKNLTELSIRDFKKNVTKDDFFKEIAELQKEIKEKGEEGKKIFDNILNPLNQNPFNNNENKNNDSDSESSSHLSD